MYKRINIIILLILLIFISYTSLDSITWERTYGGSRYDAGYFIEQTSDSGYIIAGQSNSYTTYPYHLEIYVLKIDQYGEINWYKHWGNWGSNGNCIKEKDSTYIILGDNSGPNDIYCMKLNSSGDSLWSKYYGTDDLDVCNRIINTSDNGYAIIGFTRVNGTNNRVYLIKIDSVGDMMWSRTYGSSYCEGRSIKQTEDNGFIITGTIYPTGHYDNIYLIKTDSFGDTLWSKMYGDTLGSSTINKGYDVDITDDAGYIVIGSILLKTDSLGDSLWAKSISGVAGQQTSDGGYVVVSTVGTYPYTDVCLTKTDSVGNIEWKRTFGGANEEKAYYLKQTIDGGYIITAKTYSYGAGECDVYLIKTDSLGNVGVEEEEPEIIPSDISYSFISSTGKDILFKFVYPRDGDVDLRIYDVTGRFITNPIEGYYQKGEYEENISLNSSGIYIYRLKISDKDYSGKIIIF